MNDGTGLVVDRTPHTRNYMVVFMFCPESEVGKHRYGLGMDMAGMAAQAYQGAYIDELRADSTRLRESTEQKTF
jgi:hypothetical protein